MFRAFSINMEHRGFEPLTSTLPVWRAPSCANAPHGIRYKKSRGGRTRTLDIWFWRPTFYRLNYTPVWQVKTYPQFIPQDFGSVNQYFKLLFLTNILSYHFSRIFASIQNTFFIIYYDYYGQPEAGRNVLFYRRSCPVNKTYLTYNLGRFFYYG